MIWGEKNSKMREMVKNHYKTTWNCIYKWFY